MSKRAIDFLRSSMYYRAADHNYLPNPFPNAEVADHVAVRITGGIGDLLLGVGVAEKISEKCGPTIIYSKWPDIGRLFTGLQNKDQKILEKEGLDVIVNINSLAIFQFSENFEGFYNPDLGNLYIANQNFLTQGQWPEIATHHPYLDNLLGTEAMKLGLYRDSITYASLGIPYRYFKRTPKINTGLYNFPYITVHDGYDSHNDFRNRATKNWNMKAWTDFVKYFKGRCPEIKVAQIGGETSRRIPGVDMDFVGMLSFSASLSVLNGSVCHVDGDSGMVHAARIMGVRSVVMYGPSPIKFFSYPENINIGPQGHCPGGCWWLKHDWMKTCPINYEGCEAMDSITPEEVVHGVEKIIYEKR